MIRLPLTHVNTAIRYVSAWYRAIYLFYASAYKEADKEDTVTKGSVKSHLPSEYKKKAESIYQFLLDNILIREISKGRFSVTEQGIDTLAQNLITIDYNFNTNIGAKVANFLLFCYKSFRVLLLFIVIYFYKNLQKKFYSW